jgi:MoaA/NifB/PqqE/SkfB family radical SAM enzyme
MEPLFVLSDLAHYRRESFGGILYDSVSKCAGFYDLAAAFALELFAAPTTIETVCSYFEDQQTTKTFLKKLMDRKLLQSALDTRSHGKLYFTDVKDFRDDRLHSPLGVELELTLKCSRTCTYCAYGSNPHYSTKGQLDKIQYETLFASLHDHGVCYLRFTGGDPLIRSDCLEIIECADRYPFAITIASDLSVLTPTKAARLAKIKNLVSIQTTIDGPTPEIADKNRGAGNFEKVCEGMELLTQLGVKLLVGTVLTKDNTHHIYETAQLLRRWNVAYCVSPLYSAGRGREMENLIPTDEDLGQAYEDYSAAVIEGLVSPGDPAWTPLAAGLSRELRASLWAGQPWLLRSPDRVLRIDPYGRCYAGIQLKELLGDDVYVGNILDSNVVTIWNSAPLLNQLRHMSHKNKYYGDVIDLRSTLIQQQQPSYRNELSN